MVNACSHACECQKELGDLLSTKNVKMSQRMTELQNLTFLNVATPLLGCNAVKVGRRKGNSRPKAEAWALFIVIKQRGYIT